MAKNYIKFPTDFLTYKAWPRGRKYSKIEALVFLLNNPEETICKLSKVFGWSKSTVKLFVEEMVNLGYVEDKIEHRIEQKSNKNRTLTEVTNNELQPSAEQKSNKNRTLNRTHLIENNIYPPDILSTTNVVSNISFPPKGESESRNLDFAKFQEWLSENAPRVAKMKEPFTAEQVAALKTDFEIQFICDLLKAMHNYEPLLTKNRNANLTFRNWARRRQKDDGKQTTNLKSNPSDDDLARAVAEGLARANTPQEWSSRAVGI